MKIYEGIRVLEISDEKAMYCGKLLAQAGMEVIKIEPEGGDPLRWNAPFAGGVEDPDRSLFWIYHNTGKKSITLDLDGPEGQKCFRKLVKSADVVLESLKPGKMKEYGLSYEELKEINPKLVMCSISPFGQDGPRASWNAATDMIPFAMGGAMNEVGIPGFNHSPLLIGRNYTNNSTCIYAAVAILAYLRRVKVGGEGAYIDAAVVETAAACRDEAMAPPQLFPYVAGKKQLGSAGPFPPGGGFPCKDGSVFVVAMALWGSVVDWCKEKGIDVTGLDGEEFRTKVNYNPHIEANKDAINDRISQLCMMYTKAELHAEGMRRHIPITPIYSFEDVYNEPHFRDRGFFVEVDHPVAGKTMYPGAPARLTRTPLECQVPAPLFLLAIHLSQLAVGDHYEIVVHLSHDQEASSLIAACL